MDSAPDSGSHAAEPPWSDAGCLRGESGPRIAFLRALIERITSTGLTPIEGAYYLSAGTTPSGQTADEFILYFFDFHRPARYDFPLPSAATFSATLIDPFAMTLKPVPGTFSGNSRLALPGKPYQAILFQKVGGGKAEPGKPAEPKVPDNEPG